MGKLLKLLFWLAVLWAAYAYGWPWLQETVEGIGETTASSAKGLSGGPEGRCVQLANDAADRFGDGIGRFSSPPYDTEKWGKFVGKVENGIELAEAECACGSEPCQHARNAMRELDSLVGDLDRMIRRDTDRFIQPGTAMERVYDELNRARAALP